MVKVNRGDEIIGAGRKFKSPRQPSRRELRSLRASLFKRSNLIYAVKAVENTMHAFRTGAWNLRKTSRVYPTLEQFMHEIYKRLLGTEIIHHRLIKQKICENMNEMKMCLAQGLLPTACGRQARQSPNPSANYQMRSVAVKIPLFKGEGLRVCDDTLTMMQEVERELKVTKVRLLQSATCHIHTHWM